MGSVPTKGDGTARCAIRSTSTFYDLWWTMTPMVPGSTLTRARSSAFTAGQAFTAQGVGALMPIRSGLHTLIGR
jgi:hypothetical protein